MSFSLPRIAPRIIKFLPEGYALRAACVVACSFVSACSDGATPGSPSGSGGVSSSGGATASSGGSHSSGGAPTAGGSGGVVNVGGTTVGSGGAPMSGGAAATGGAGPEAGGAPASGGGSGSGGESSGTGGAFAFPLTSPAFENMDGCSVENLSVCDVIPDENVSLAGGANRSPELHWTGAPEGTQSFALVLMDVTFGQAHWALWNISADTTMIAADVPQDSATPATPVGTQQANANFATTSEHGYFGPHVSCNVFEFELYALSTSTFTPKNTESAVLVAIELQDLGDVLGVARLRGRSEDPATPCE